MARAIAKAHTMSESDDSDTEWVRARTGSEDLFADSDDNEDRALKNKGKLLNHEHTYFE